MLVSTFFYIFIYIRQIYYPLILAKMVMVIRESQEREVENKDWKLKAKINENKTWKGKKGEREEEKRYLTLPSTFLLSRGGIIFRLNIYRQG